jgi:c-di-GMP-binding flagellar brake protein YcgR
MTSSDRRSSERIPVDCKVSFFHLPPSSNPPIFRTLNLSLLGACIESPTLFVPGAVLSFHLITSDHQVLDIRAQVVHSESNSSALYHVGVRFTKLTERDREILGRQFERVRVTIQ